MPTQLINLPNREYWLSPERREATLRRLGVWFTWLAAAHAALLVLAVELTIRANIAHTQLDTTTLTVGLGLLGVAVLSQLVLLYRRFRLPNAA